MADIRGKIAGLWRRFIQAERKVEETIHEMEHVAGQVVHDVEELVVKAERRTLKLTRDFLRLESAGGILLMAAAILAMIIANSPLYDTYHYALEAVKFRIGFSDRAGNFDAVIEQSVLHWINDGMMAVFFFLVGLEIKREFVAGELASRDRVILPLLAAAGGMAVPALIFWWFNAGNPENMTGWAIPAATDIAFALGVISLLGSRVPGSLKVLLLAIAIIDDIGAILIIAFFYAGEIWTPPLYFAGAALITLAVLNWYNVTAKTSYILASIVLWVAVLESGLHATLAGVVAALFIPMADKRDPECSPLHNMEHALHPWVAFGILPLFAFANAGVPFEGASAGDMLNPVSLGIAVGLIVGKQVGIFSMLWLAIKTGLSPKPKGASWLQLYAMSTLCGIGFTMSLFIGTLAYASMDMQISVRVGVLGGSVLSAIAGYLLLLYSSKKQNEGKTHDE